jgi:hypothetical protein
VSRDGWLSALGIGPRERRPFRSRYLEAMGRPAKPPVIEHVEIAYERWHGEILDPKRDWMGKGRGCVKPLDGAQPEPSCNEVEVAKLLRARLGYEAWFFTTWPSIPEDWRPWVSHEAAMPEWLRRLDEKIRDHPYGPASGGMPDVVGWDPGIPDPVESAVFVECKKPGEPVGKNQEPWVARAIALGVPPEAFAVAVRISR